MALKVFAIRVVEFLDVEPTSQELRRLKVLLPSWEKTQHPLWGQRWHKPAQAVPRCVMKAPKGTDPSYMLSSSSLLDSVSCCLCPTDARGGSDFMGFLPTGRVAWATAQDERQHVCLQPLGGRGAVSRCLWDINTRNEEPKSPILKIVAHLWGLRDGGENSVYV